MVFSTRAAPQTPAEPPLQGGIFFHHASCIHQGSRADAMVRPAPAPV